MFQYQCQIVRIRLSGWDYQCKIISVRLSDYQIIRLSVSDYQGQIWHWCQQFAAVAAVAMIRGRWSFMGTMMMMITTTMMMMMMMMMMMLRTRVSQKDICSNLSSTLMRTSWTIPPLKPVAIQYDQRAFITWNIYWRVIIIITHDTRSPPGTDFQLEPFGPVYFGLRALQALRPTADVWLLFQFHCSE